MSPQQAAAADSTRQDPRWQSVLARDPDADGRFFYSVQTTGVYCRPSCPSRQARPENVRFHVTPEEAERAGYRPCRRCRPDQGPLAEQQARLVAEACRHIEQSVDLPSPALLAERAGLSAAHFHRLFKSVAGVTPMAYARAHRGERLRSRLGEGAPVTTAMLDAGFNSSGRLYAVSDQLLGMTPSRFRAGGDQVRIRFAIGQCALGALLVAASDRGLCSIALGDEPGPLLRELQDRFPNAELVGGDAGFEDTVARVAGFIESPAIGLELPLDVRGTAFQQRVWQALRDIPAGATASYADIAARIGAPRSVRAVAGACAANTLAVAIPCHRVVRTDGGISGYRWGVERKRRLLDTEAGC